jgi:uncharacterized protein (DUF433 family)
MVTVLNPHVELVEGSARVVGTPFRVADVAAIYVFGHSPIDWIVENYALTRAQIHAALAYYYDHQAEVEQEWRETEKLAREVALPAEDVLARMKARLRNRDGG